jgi:hypothetical protein
MITKTWDVNYLEVIPTINNMANVVSVIHWSLKGNDGANNSSLISAATQIGSPTGDFIQYNSLTKQTVIGWLHNTIGAQEVANLEASIEQVINLNIQKRSTNLIPPWNT